MKPIVVPPLVLLAFAAGGSFAVPPRAAFAEVKSLVVVGGDTLTTQELDLEISATMMEAKGKSLPAMKADDVLKRMVQNRLLEQEGYRIKADKMPTVRNQVREYIRLKSMKALLDSLAAPQEGLAAPSPDSLVGQVGMMRRYSHILVKDRTLAASLRDSLSHGVPFADLARRHSADNTSSSGGDLGWAAEGVYVDAFEAAASRLSPDQIAGPVETQFGWHLITLTGVRADTLKSQGMAQALVQAREQERTRVAIESRLDSLRTALGVTVNDSLLKTLDYKSENADVKKRLQTSEEVLAVVPTGNLTVRGLTRNIQFKYFHGLSDRAEADQIRDRMLQDWVTEALLTFEARRRGLDRDPALLVKASAEERRLLREEVLNNILESDYKPSDQEIRAWYGTHQNDFIPESRARVQSVLAKNAEAARQLRAEIDKGAALKWIAVGSPGDVDSLPPLPTGWMSAGDLGLTREGLVKGAGVGPKEMPGGWAVAQITAVENPGPRPLDDCREDVIRALRGVHYREAIHDAIGRLESVTDVQTLPGAKEVVAGRLERLQAARPGGEQQ